MRENPTLSIIVVSYNTREVTLNSQYSVYAEKHWRPLRFWMRQQIILMLNFVRVPDYIVQALLKGSDKTHSNTATWCQVRQNQKAGDVVIYDPCPAQKSGNASCCNCTAIKTFPISGIVGTPPYPPPSSEENSCGSL